MLPANPGEVMGKRFRRVLARRLSNKTFRRYHQFRAHLVARRYTDANPLSLITIDPRRIEQSIIETAPAYPQWGRVQGGDWDRQSEPFDERPVPRAIAAHYTNGRPWRETPLYDHFAELLTRYGDAWGYSSMAGFDRRCAEIERLYESIRNHGYRTRTHAPTTTAETRLPLALLIDEINVDIGRDGTPLWRSHGQHRLAIAKLLDIDAVPVFVHRRHRRWQAVRDVVRTTPPSALDTHLETVREHPDLASIDGGRDQ